MRLLLTTGAVGAGSTGGGIAQICAMPDSSGFAPDIEERCAAPDHGAAAGGLEFNAKANAVICATRVRTASRVLVTVAPVNEEWIGVSRAVRVLFVETSCADEL